MNDTSIKITKDSSGKLKINALDNFEGLKHFPIQIIDLNGILWITLWEYIDFKSLVYRKLALFDSRNGTWMYELLRQPIASYYFSFASGDIIRNPTLEEIQWINSSLKRNNVTFNRKTNKLINNERIL